MKSKQYTIRSIPSQVDRALRRQAQASGKSLNQLAVEALAKQAGFDEQPKLFTDLDFLIGSWVDDPACERALESFEQVDEDLWR
jgi:hypothetical protein